MGVQPLDCAGRPLSMHQAVIMGVLNVTPDSFSDGGLFNQLDQAVSHAIHMHRQGAHIIDIGGESTRPGADPVGVEEELERVIPVIERLRQELPIPVSIDTRKPQVMQAAVRAGAGFINDVGGFESEQAVQVAAQSGVPVCVMHMQGQPKTMQQQPSYANVVAEVMDFLSQRVQRLLLAGVAPERIVIDPGFGFGKTVEHNLVLLKHLAELRQLGYPLLVGLSRKSMIGKLWQKEVHERSAASVSLAQMALERGASILRVHDVAETADMVRLWQCMQNPEITVNLK